MGESRIGFGPGLELAPLVGWGARRRELAMLIRPIIHDLLMIAAPIGLCSCIGATEAVPYDAAVPKSSLADSEEAQSSVKKKEMPCESPEMMTGDIRTAGSTPCAVNNQQRTGVTSGTTMTQIPEDGTGLDNQQRTWEPPEMHRY